MTATPVSSSSTCRTARARARGFSRQPVQPGRRRHDRPVARLAPPSVLVVAPPQRRQDAPGQRVASAVGRARLRRARSARGRRDRSARRALLVEDLHAGIADERVLFHLLNLVREHKLSMLLTSRTPPGELEVQLPDLRSRLRALPVVAIAPPDEVLLKAVLVKHFTDRQLAVEPDLIGYLASSMERSMEAAAAIVAEIDRAAMASHRKVTRALAAEVLARQHGRSCGEPFSPPRRPSC